MQKLQEKCEHQSRTLASLEERCISLKSTIDQLNISLEKASTSENDLRSEIHSLQRSLLEVTSNSHSGAEKLKQVRFDWPYGFSYLSVFFNISEP